MPVFDEKQEELEHYETMMGVPRGRLAVTMDSITDAMALVGQHGVAEDLSHPVHRPVPSAGALITLQVTQRQDAQFH